MIDGGTSRTSAATLDAVCDAQDEESPLHVVVIDEELPYPLNSGKRIRTYNLLRRLASEFRITYVAHRNQQPGEADSAAEQLRSVGIRPIVVPRSVPVKAGWRFYGRLFGNLFSDRPYSVTSHTSGAMRKCLSEMARAQRVDLWHCEWTPYFANLPTDLDKPVVIAAHNIESQIWQRYCENATNPAKRWYIALQWKKFRRFEIQSFSRAAQTIFVSRSDAALARRDYSAQRCEVVENGVDLDYFRPQFNGRDPFQLLVMGSLDWRPNVDGIEQFLQQVFPRLVAQDARYRLTIVGRNPNAEWAATLQRTPGVALHANVADVRPYVAQAGALVVPLRIGGGSRLKILEAAASGLPIISTTVGAEGLELHAGQHFWGADEITLLGDAIGAAASDPLECERRAQAAYGVVRGQYSWNNLARSLGTAWRRAAQCRIG